MAAQREWFEKDYYKILGVPESASQKEITREYRKLAKKYHPDANPGSEEKFKEISAAYDVLGNEETRKEYDEVRRLGPAGAGFGNFGGTAQGGYTTFNVDDLGDLFGGLFNRGAASSRQPTGPRRGSDLETDLTISFLDSVRGLETTLSLTSDATCSVCNGTGAAPGTMPVVCPTCGGRGTLEDNQGLFSLAQTCPTCGGSGMIIEDPCKNCRGTGVERRARQVRVRIPAGVHDAQRIRLKDRGAPGLNGGPPGDLFVRVHVTPHPLFGRKGNDLTITVPITFSEAALGAEIKVPTLSNAVTVRIPGGTKSGKTFRVKKHGVNNGRSQGDLLVTVEIVVPEKLSSSEKKAAQAFAEASKFNPREHFGVG
jgi:molecular chaperone DnaJ